MMQHNRAWALWIILVLAVVAAAGVYAGERIYNGIVLPEVWPPRDVDPKDIAPMAQQYHIMQSYGLGLEDVRDLHQLFSRRELRKLTGR